MLALSAGDSFSVSVALPSLSATVPPLALRMSCALRLLITAPVEALSSVAVIVCIADVVRSAPVVSVNVAVIVADSPASMLSMSPSLVRITVLPIVSPSLFTVFG